MRIKFISYSPETISKWEKLSTSVQYEFAIIERAYQHARKAGDYYTKQLAMGQGKDWCEENGFTREEWGHMFIDWKKTELS